MRRSDHLSGPEEELESISLLASPARVAPASIASNRRGFQVHRMERDLDWMEDVESQATIHSAPSTSADNVRFRAGSHRSWATDDLAVTRALFSKYEDFHTIDWQRDLTRDRLRHKLIAQRRLDFPLGLIQGLWDAGSGWICVLLVALAAGVVAGVIDIGTRWISDLKDGVCLNRFWLDREHCCWSANDTAYKDFDCTAWVTWPEMLHFTSKNMLSTSIEFIFYVAWASGLALLAVLLVKVFAPYACGSGVPEIKCILSGFVIRGYLGKWTFIIKSVALMLVTASGMCLGKEGPMVHLACCIGNIFSYLFPKYGMNEAKKREILSASAAAGVSVAFGAPIGGVLFSLEEASYYFPLKTMWRSFFCALIAGIVLRFVNPFGSDQTSLFHVDYAMKWQFWELVSFALLGAFGGALGFCFIKANIAWCARRKQAGGSLGAHPVREVVFVAFVTAVLSFGNPFTRRSGSALIKTLFDRCGPEDYMADLCDYRNISFSTTKTDDNYHSGEFGEGVKTALWELLYALILKFVMTIFTFGMKVPCGLFVPSLSMGAIAGRILGIIMEKVATGLQEEGVRSVWSCEVGRDCVMPGLYAMVGAAAVLGGVTRMTVSLVVIMFELTGSLEFIVPTMVAVMFAKWVGDALSPQGIYDAHIELNGYPFLDNKGEYPSDTAAAEVMRPTVGSNSELVVLPAKGMTVGEATELMRRTDYNGFPVVASRANHFLVGFCTRRELSAAIETARRSQANVTDGTMLLLAEVDDANDVGPSTERRPSETDATSPSSVLRLGRIVDLAPACVTDAAPMETVIDMMRRLGLRHVLVSRAGQVLGILTKKDVLQFMRRQHPVSVNNPLFK